MSNKQSQSKAVEFNIPKSDKMEKGAKMMKKKETPKSNISGNNLLSEVRQVMEELEHTGAKNLHHVSEIHDASAPKIEKGLKIHKNNRKALMNSIEKGAKLHHAQSIKDKSAPVLDSSIHIKKVSRDPFLKQVQKGTKLTHVTKVHDMSAPKLPHAAKECDIKKLMKEIETTGNKKLRQVKITHDASAPVIEKGIKINKNENRNKLMNSIKQGKFELKKAPFINDRSAPKIEMDVHIKKSQHTQLLKEVTQHGAPITSVATAAVSEFGHKVIETVASVVDKLKDMSGFETTSSTH